MVLRQGAWSVLLARTTIEEKENKEENRDNEMITVENGENYNSEDA